MTVLPFLLSVVPQQFVLLSVTTGWAVQLADFAVTGLVALCTSRFLERKVVLTADGRLTVSYGRRRIELDARRITEIHRPRRAGIGLGSVLLRWDGGQVRLWSVMRYESEAADWVRTSHPRGPAEEFRDFAFRLYLLNPAITVTGIRRPGRIWRFVHA